MQPPSSSPSSAPEWSPGGSHLYDLSGRPILLETLWADQPVILVFVRHYG